MVVASVVVVVGSVLVVVGSDVVVVEVEVELLEVEEVVGGCVVVGPGAVGLVTGGGDTTMGGGAVGPAVAGEPVVVGPVGSGILTPNDPSVEESTTKARTDTVVVDPACPSPGAGIVVRSTGPVS